MVLKMEEPGDKKCSVSRMAESGKANQDTGASVLLLQDPEFCDHPYELLQPLAPDENTAQMIT